MLSVYVVCLCRLFSLKVTINTIFFHPIILQEDSLKSKKRKKEKKSKKAKKEKKKKRDKKEKRAGTGDGCSDSSEV